MDEDKQIPRGRLCRRRRHCSIGSIQRIYERRGVCIGCYLRLAPDSGLGMPNPDDEGVK